MNRRKFLGNCGQAALASSVARYPELRELASPIADYTLRIAPLKLELARGRTVDTIAYNDSVPGPLLRVRAGTPITVDVVNDTSTEELVHWHGLHIPSDVDGVMEEGTPMIPPHQRRSYTFTPGPVGTRWYHSHAAAGRNIHRSTYTGQFGFMMIDAPGDPGSHDQEIFLALHDWEPFISGGDDGFQMVMYEHASINGKLLGAGEPIRVREGERVLLRVLNASASEAHWLALPGHSFTVLALDGNPVPNPKSVDQLRIDPGERIDAVVEMRQPGVWILGEPRDAVRQSGLGVVVEYAGHSGTPEWRPAEVVAFDYATFGASALPADPSIVRIPLAFKSAFHGHGAFEGWTINGRSYPKIDPIYLHEGSRYRLVFDNQSIEDHPVHLHRHTLELVSIAGQGTSGVHKDVIVVPARSIVEADFTANNAGKSLFHCHLQDHMDAGFMMLFDYR